MDAIVYKRVVDVRPESIEGAIIRFPGLESTITDVYVRLTRLDSTMMTGIVRPTKPFVELLGERSFFCYCQGIYRAGLSSYPDGC